MSTSHAATTNLFLEAPPDPFLVKLLESTRANLAIKREAAAAEALEARELNGGEELRDDETGAIIELQDPEETQRSYDYVDEALEHLEKQLKAAKTIGDQQRAFIGTLQEILWDVELFHFDEHAYELAMQTMEAIGDAYSKANPELAATAKNPFHLINSYAYLAEKTRPAVSAMVIAYQLHNGIPRAECEETIYGLARTLRPEIDEMAERNPAEIKKAIGEVFLEIFEPYRHVLPIRPCLEMAYFIDEEARHCPPQMPDFVARLHGKRRLHSAAIVNDNVSTADALIDELHVPHLYDEHTIAHADAKLTPLFMQHADMEGDTEDMMNMLIDYQLATQFRHTEQDSASRSSVSTTRG